MSVKGWNKKIEYICSRECANVGEFNQEVRGGGEGGRATFLWIYEGKASGAQPGPARENAPWLTYVPTVISVFRVLTYLAYLILFVKAKIFL